MLVSVVCLVSKEMLVPAVSKAFQVNVESVVRLVPKGLLAAVACLVRRVTLVLLERKDVMDVMVKRGLPASKVLSVSVVFPGGKGTKALVADRETLVLTGQRVLPVHKVHRVNVALLESLVNQVNVVRMVAPVVTVQQV